MGDREARQWGDPILTAMKAEDDIGLHQQPTLSQCVQDGQLLASSDGETRRQSAGKEGLRLAVSRLREPAAVAPGGSRAPSRPPRNPHGSPGTYYGNFTGLGSI